MQRSLVPIILLIICTACGPSVIYEEHPVRKVTATEINQALKATQFPSSKELKIFLRELTEEDLAYLESYKSSQADLKNIKLPPVKIFQIENGDPSDRYNLFTKLMNDQVYPNAKDLSIEALNKFFFFQGAFMPGEPIAFAAVSTRTNQIAVYEYVPYPIEAKRDGKSVSVKMIDTERKIFLVSLKGFYPEEKINVSSRSDDQTLTYNLTANLEGVANSISAPISNNPEGGTCVLSITSDQITTPLVVEFDFGKFGKKQLGEVF